MRRNYRKIIALALTAALVIPAVTSSNSASAEVKGYSFINDYTLGYEPNPDDPQADGHITVYHGGTDYEYLEDTDVPVYGKKSDNPFGPQIKQAWDTEELKLSQPVQYTTEDGKVHDIESMLTNFDFIADPTAIDNSDVDGKLYVYGTTEAFDYNGSGQMTKNSYSNHSLTILSTTDMVNWTDEGFMDNQNLTNLRSDASGKVSARGRWNNHAWAPSGLKIDADKDGDDEYYLFHTDGGSVVYVRGESPTGPWVDDLGTSICNTSLPNCRDVKWCFDPAVLADGDNAYVYFGGGCWDTESELRQHPNATIASPKTGRVAKIKFDNNGKVSIDGTPQVLDNYYMFEDSEINKFNDKYFYSYCTNFHVPESGDEFVTPGSIAVYVSSDPMIISFDPTADNGAKYTDGEGIYHNYLGTILDNPSTIYGQFYNNHHHMQEFKGHFYIFYHSTALNNALHRYSQQYRNLHVDEIKVDKDTDKIDINPTYEGAEQIEAFNPFKAFDGSQKVINATTTSYSAGVSSTRDDIMVEESDNGSPMVLDNINTGDWTKIQGVDFGQFGATKVSALINSTTEDGAIEVFIDDPTDPDNKVCTMAIEDTGKEYYDYVSSDAFPVAGKHDVYFVFRGDGYKVASWQFEEGTTVPPTRAPKPTEVPSNPSVTQAPAQATAPVASQAPVVKKAVVKVIGKKTVKVGKTLKLKAKLTNVKGKVKWSVNKKKLATISKAGKLKAKKKGTVKVTAKVGKVKGSLKIKIK